MPSRSELLAEVEAWRQAKNVVGVGLGAAWKLVKDTPHDIKTMRMAHKALTRVKPVERVTLLKGKFAGQKGGFAPSLSQRLLAIQGDLMKGRGAHTRAEWDRLWRENALVTKQRDRFSDMRTDAVKKNAIRLGALALGATAGSYAYRAFKLRKRQAEEKPKFRKYQVYPQYNFSTAPVQPENRPMYYGDDSGDVPLEVPGSGPPRVEEAEATPPRRLAKMVPQYPVTIQDVKNTKGGKRLLLKNKLIQAGLVGAGSAYLTHAISPLVLAPVANALAKPRKMPNIKLDFTQGHAKISRLPGYTHTPVLNIKRARNFYKYGHAGTSAAVGLYLARKVYKDPGVGMSSSTKEYVRKNNPDWKRRAKKHSEKYRQYRVAKAKEDLERAQERVQAHEAKAELINRLVEVFYS